MNKKIEITKERLEQLEGFESVVQTMKDNGFDTFMSVKDFLKAHNEVLDRKTKLLDELTKAKILLNEWVELFKPKVDNIPPIPIQVETELFLKETK